MIFLPVIERELRATARQPFTYHLRLLGVFSLVSVLIFFALHGDIGPDSGGELFSALHCALFFAVWCLVPLLTADCISRERREGTLPLLFLTPLKARDLVWAKGAAHGLRAFTLWLAVLPVLTICLVAGGVSWPEVLLSVLVNFAAICGAAAAGLTASACTRVWSRSLALAMILALVLFLGSLYGMFGSLALAVRFVAPNMFPIDEHPMLVGYAMCTNWDRCWPQVLSSSRLGHGPVLAACAAFALSAFVVLLLLIRLAGWAVQRNWRYRAPSARALWWEKKFFQPAFFQNVLKRWLRWELQRNPIGWLERRSWSGRLVVWSWLAVVVCLYSSLFSNMGLYERGFHQMQMLLAWLLAGSIALSAAGSFRRERESGVLELLLVAPLRESQIILGRVRGLWGQFLPAIVLLCAVWLYCAAFLMSQSEWRWMFAAVVTFATTPLVGLYFSLRSNFMAALLCTLGLHLVIPSVFGQLLDVFLNESGLAGGFAPDAVTSAWVVTPMLQVLLAAFFGWRLLENLRQRNFARQASR